MAVKMEDNMKKVYVINLDKKRILILVGAILSVVGTAFYAGSMQKNSGYTAYEDFNSIMESGKSNNNLVSNSGELTPLEPIPELEIQSSNIPSNKPVLRTEEDPFLNAPARRVTQQTTISTSQNDTASLKPIKEITNSTGKYYTIQLGAYKRETDAIRYVNELGKKGIQARVDRGVMFYFVRAGKFKDKSDLEPLYKKIHDSLKLEAIVVYRTLS